MLASKEGRVCKGTFSTVLPLYNGSCEQRAQCWVAPKRISQILHGWCVLIVDTTTAQSNLRSPSHQGDIFSTQGHRSSSFIPRVFSVFVWAGGQYFWVYFRVPPGILTALFRWFSGVQAIPSCSPPWNLNDTGDPHGNSLPLPSLHHSLTAAPSFDTDPGVSDYDMYPGDTEGHTGSYSGVLSNHSASWTVEQSECRCIVPWLVMSFVL